MRMKSFTSWIILMIVIMRLVVLGNPVMQHQQTPPTLIMQYSYEVLTLLDNGKVSTCAASTITSCLKGYHDLTMKMKYELISTLFTPYIQDLCFDPWVIDKFPNDFLKLCIEAVKNLHDQGKDNLIYHTAKCFSLRHNSSQTRLPIGQMPFGLLDYIVKFLSLDMTNNLKCEKDYEDWQLSMYANFGVKWVCMNRVPAWEFDIEETATDSRERKFMNTVSQGTA